MILGSTTLQNQAFILKPVVSSLSTVEVYEKLKDKPFSFFLDSALANEDLGRYSIIGFDPFLVFKSKGNTYSVLSSDTVTESGSNPLGALRALMQKYTLPKLEGHPPLLGGAVGYFAYNLGEQLEVLPEEAVDDLDIPDTILGFYDALLIYDHGKGEWLISSTGFPEETATLIAKRAQARFDEFKELLYGKPDLNESSVKLCADLELKSNFQQEEYCQAVQKAIDFIAAGDIFQVNLSQRFEANLPIEPFELYKILREINPAPFASYLNYPEVIVASASPERYLLVEGDRVETRPIKGTRPRGSSLEEDLANRQELETSIKDRAELVMIIDLERNDLGRVCSIGSVKVPDLIRLEEYATVFHLVSTVEGQLAPDKDVIDLIAASFPGGSITGAPKIRAMEIIDELEPVKRNIYTGSIGWLSFDGNADLNIVIRTFVIKNDKVYYQVGGGIVADSVPQLEYEETLTKGKALRRALDVAIKRSS